MPDSTGPTPRTSKVWSTWKWVGGAALPEVGPCVQSAALPAMWPLAGVASLLELWLEGGRLAEAAVPAAVPLGGVGALPELWPAVAASGGTAAAPPPWPTICGGECPFAGEPVAEWLPNPPGCGSAALLVHPEPSPPRLLAAACASRAAACCPPGTLLPAAASCCASSPRPCSVQRCPVISTALWHRVWCPARYQLNQASTGRGTLLSGVGALNSPPAGAACLGPPAVEPSLELGCWRPAAC